nr:immunoglobulin light chain junction region [Macaca mulatta]
CQQQYSYPYSF